MEIKENSTDSSKSLRENMGDTYVYTEGDKLLRSPESSIMARKAGNEWVLEVLGVPYGGPIAGKDYQGQYFTERTNLMMDIGDERPVIYYHGDNPSGKPEMNVDVIGRAKAVRRDSKGLWFEVILDKGKKYAARVYQAALRGAAKASSGTVDYLVRWTQDGELLQWPVAELSLLDAVGGRIPANPYATVSVKALFSDAGIDLPEAFVKDDGESSKTLAVQEDESEDEHQSVSEIAALLDVFDAADKIISNRRQNNG